MEPKGLAPRNDLFRKPMTEMISGSRINLKARQAECDEMLLLLHKMEKKISQFCILVEVSLATIIIDNQGQSLNSRAIFQKGIQEE